VRQVERRRGERRIICDFSGVYAPVSPSVSVCIATYRRNEQLRAVLEDLRRQQRLPDEVIIVDNDATGAARCIVEQFQAADAPFRVDYDVQPVPNIALTRNRTVELAHGEWLAFIDDDERAPTDWLQQLLHAAQIYEADGVVAPVEPQVPPTAPAWIRRGRFYDFPHQPSGATVPLNRMRFGNVLLRSQRLRSENGPFDSRFALMAGEDVDLLVRLAHKGARIVWYEEAPVFEPVDPKRLSLRWLLMRAFSGGQGFSRATVAGFFRPIGWAGRCLFFFRALLQMVVAAVLTVLSWPIGRHHAAAWLIKAYANLGKLSVLWGSRYHAYARSTSPETTQRQPET
jgi:succinoglycan biosynthesis protein ExoM